jgi:hypothetical protein
MVCIPDHHQQQQQQQKKQQKKQQQQEKPQQQQQLRGSRVLLMDQETETEQLNKQCT